MTMKTKIVIDDLRRLIYKSVHDYEIVDIDTEDYASSMVIGHDDRSGKMCEKGITKKKITKNVALYC